MFFYSSLLSNLKKKNSTGEWCEWLDNGGLKAKQTYFFMLGKLQQGLRWRAQGVMLDKDREQGLIRKGKKLERN